MSVPIKGSTGFHWKASVYLVPLLNLTLYLAKSIPSYEIFFLFFDKRYTTDWEKQLHKNKRGKKQTILV